MKIVIQISKMTIIRHPQFRSNWQTPSADEDNVISEWVLDLNNLKLIWTTFKAFSNLVFFFLNTQNYGNITAADATSTDNENNTTSNGYSGGQHTISGP